jgi:hypothetical protein
MKKIRKNLTVLKTGLAFSGPCKKAFLELPWPDILYNFSGGS